MKKNLLALAALTAFAGVASAQSSVTMYGRVDLSGAKPIGTKDKGIQNGSGSRLGMRGSEDLGGGMRAIFQIETRFDADTGAAGGFNITPAGGTTANANRFWGARSVVGLSGGFGEITLGREYVTAFLGTQLRGDIWGWDTVAAHNDVTGLGGIAKVRNDSALTYKFGAAGFSLQAQIAEAKDTINRFNSKPVNFNIGYGAGPIDFSVGYEKTGNVNEKMTSVQAGYNFGFFRPSFYYATGTTTANVKRKGLMLSASVPLGAGELRAAYGTLDQGSTDLAKRTSLGYHYSLSKRTTIYADASSNSANGAPAATKAAKTGYDFGLKHNF